MSDGPYPLDKHILGGGRRSIPPAPPPQTVQFQARDRRGTVVRQRQKLSGIPRGTHLPHLINVGFGHQVVARRIVGILDLRASKGLQLYVHATQKLRPHWFLDATKRRQRRSLLVLDTGHVIVSSLSRGKLGLLMQADLEANWRNWSRLADQEPIFVEGPPEMPPAHVPEVAE